MFGGGLRSVVDVSPAAFLGTLCNTLPSMIDRINEEGVQMRGFLPALSPLLGMRSFDAGLDAHRFEHLLSSTARLGRSMLHWWSRLQTEVGDLCEGPLSEPVAGAGGASAKIQRQITKQREQVRFQQLDVDARALPAGDMRREAWVNVDKFSTTWVTAWPTQDLQLSNPEFLEVSTFYFGLASPACASAVEERIAGGRTSVDRYGVRLAAAVLPGDGWRTQHDAIKWRMSADSREMQARLRTEVYGLFAAAMPQEARQRAAAMPVRKRQGLVPDFLAHVALDGPERPLLLELKTLHYGSSTYPGGTDRCGAVAKRARALPSEYAAKARGADQKYCGTAPGNVGPVESLLRTYEPVRGLVFGAWGEASPMVEQLLSVLAAIGAERHWRAMRCREVEDAR